MENLKKQSKQNRKNPIIEFFWFSSGANVDILRNCPTDHSKYFGIGGTILFTALMASFAGGYAFFTAFENQTLSIIFGIFWGTMIFNLDRYIVVTLGKGDGTPRITKGELLSATPRLLMAILIGFVIATPLELKLFEKELNVEIATLINEEVAKLGTADSTIIAERNKLENEKIDLNSKKDQINLGTYTIIEDSEKIEISEQVELKKTEIRGLQTRILSFANARNRADTTRIRDWNNNIRSTISRLDRDINTLQSNLNVARISSTNKKKKEIDKIDLRINTIDNRLDEINATINSKTIEREDVAKQYNGFMARIEAYQRLQDKHLSLRIVGIFITLLFIFIEVAPVFFKMMTESGPYDDMYERVKHEVYVQEKQKISDVNDKINCDIEISTKKNQNRLNAEVAANDELLKSIALAQAEIAKVAIEKWKQKEIQKANENPESFIQAS
jgi:hypothetical protein